MSAYRIERVNDPAEFLQRTEALRLARPIETNVVGSVAQSVVDGSRHYPVAYWWLVLDDDVVVGAALHTPHYRPVITPMPTAVVPLLAEAIHGVHPTVRGVTGPEPEARVFAQTLNRLTGEDCSEVTLRELVYVLGEHSPRAGVKGHARLAGESDVPMLVVWFEEFGQEALGSIHRVTPEDVSARLSNRPMLIWEAEGEPVAMAGHAALTPSPAGLIGRIGPVFTAREHRGHGYGAAITSAMIEYLQESGCVTVMLYTDEDYLQSNKVYRTLGFTEVGAVVELGQPSD